MFNDSFLDSLNEQQRAAVTSKAKHLRIIAGAGTGKTRALTYRIAYILATTDISHKQLVAITFTNKVANEMKDRVSELVCTYGLPISGLPYISTYHAFCLRFLRFEIDHLEGLTKNFTISDDDDRKRFLKEVSKKMNISEKSTLYQALTSELDSIKCKGLLPEEVKEADIENSVLSLDQFVNFYQTYQDLLIKNNTLDFDDILIYAYKLISTNKEVKERYKSRYKAILVDEYQDTNDLQYKLIKEFLGEDSLFTVVGDPDQTIYTWRGANSRLIRNVLMDDFKDLETVVLNKNYRSTQTILDTANSLINHNIDRDKKDLIAASGLVGEDIDFKCLPSQDLEAKYIASKIYESVLTKKANYNDIAIIYRSNYLSLSIEKALSSKRIPYKIFGGHRFYDRAVIKDALAYLKILINPSDDSSVLRILKAPTRGMGPIAVAKLTEYADTNQISYLQAIVDDSDSIGFNTKTVIALDEFKKALGNALYSLSNPELKEEDVSMVINDYFEASGFIEHIRRNDKNKSEKDGKGADKEMENLIELLNNIKTFFIEPIEDQELLDSILKDTGTTEIDIPTKLSLFLSNVMLMSQQDDMDNSNSVNLMTVHVSKGLEFKEVFVTGLVNGVFPTNHALTDLSNRDEALEEERRMLYVAFTRAKKRLHASWFGGYNYVTGSNCLPSMFLSEAGLIKNYRELSERSVNPYSSSGRNNYTQPKVNTYNNVNEIKSLLNSIQREKETTGDIYKQGLAARKTTAFNFKVGMKVISTSYGIGEVTAVDKDKITAFFPEKENGSKTVKFINGSLAFKPYTEE